MGDYLLTNNYFNILIEAYIGDDNNKCQTPSNNSFIILKPTFGKKFNDKSSADFCLDMNSNRKVLDNLLSENIYLINYKYNFSNFMINLGLGTDFDDGTILHLGIKYEINENLNIHGSLEQTDKNSESNNMYILGIKTLKDTGNDIKIGIQLETLLEVDQTEQTRTGYKVSPLLQFDIPSNDKKIKPEIGFTMGRLTNDKEESQPLDNFYGLITIDDINKDK